MSTLQTPLVRTQDGAVLGVDQRRLRGIVPGVVGAQFVVPGDHIQLVEDFDVLVLEVSSSRAGVDLATETDGGSPLTVRRQWDEPVRVVSVGAFDDRGPQS